MIELEWKADGDAVIKPTGDLNWVVATALRHVVQDLLRLGVNFVIDLRSTSGVDATGASALVGTTCPARALGPSVSIVNPRPSVRRQLELMRIDQLILCPNVDTGATPPSHSRCPDQPRPRGPGEPIYSHESGPTSLDLSPPNWSSEERVSTFSLQVNVDTDGVPAADLTAERNVACSKGIGLRPTSSGRADRTVVRRQR